MSDSSEVIVGMLIIGGLYYSANFIYNVAVWYLKKRQDDSEFYEEPEKIPTVKEQGIPIQHPYRAPAEIEKPVPKNTIDITKGFVVKPPSYGSPVISITPSNTSQSISINFSTNEKPFKYKTPSDKNRVCPRCHEQYVLSTTENTLSLKCSKCNITINCDMNDDIDKWVETANRMIR